MATFVLVHGGWDGAWAWRGIARELQAAGHDVFTPTLTGSGERVHLATPDIDLDTHILDVVNVLRYENLDEVILVGYSYGGMVVTGVAEQVPERISQLVYLDAFVPEDGQTLGDMVDPAVNAAFVQLAEIYGEGWRYPHNPPDADRRTSLLRKPTEQPLRVGNPAAAAIKRIYVHFTAKPDDSVTKPIMQRIAQRVRAAGWQVRELPYDHFPQLDYPRDIANLLHEFA
jgi:pimeloyl-ACP methyl ester carboxylesterase